MKKLILLVNLGAPEEPTLHAIRKFLRQFLSDKRVVPISRLIWYPLLFLIILPLRAKKLTAKYRLIWRNDGTHPLIFYTKRQAQLLTSQLNSRDVSVDYAFSYGSKSIAATLATYLGQNPITELQLIPLYPQYSSTTTASVIDQVNVFFEQQIYIPQIQIINSFAENPDYIHAIVKQITMFWDEHGHGDFLLFSFHSLPLSLIAQGDPYYQECCASYHAISVLLKEYNVAHRVTFQSKFGKAQWLEPATIDEIIRLAASGVKVLDVICPGFVSDCLETLEEVAISYRKIFIKHGGQELRYIPCLNDGDDLLELLTKLSN